MKRTNIFSMLKNVEIKNYFKISAVVLAVLFAFLFDFYLVLVENYLQLSVHENIVPFLEASLPLISKKLLIILFVLFFIIFTILLNPKLKNKVLNFIYVYRFYLAFLAFVVAVIFQIHGSSLSRLIIGTNDHKALFGVSRLIRSDEFNVNTPFALSQYFNNFGYFSDIVRGVPTDMFISYGQPVLDFAVIFRPFHWGYLLLSQGYGLSFFWMGRLIALFVVSFEFGRFFTNNNKRLSLAYAILITFSPVVQWWFAINMLVEMLIFGQLAIVLTNYYMHTLDYRKRLIISLAFVICAGGFILAMYPAWEIPFAYVFAILFIWTVFKDYKNFKFTKNDLGLFAITFVLLGVAMVYIFLKSQGTILAIMNTVYPGARAYYGGLDVFVTHNPLFVYFKSLITPLVLSDIYVEVTSVSFVSFFPAGIILFILIRFIQKKKEWLLLVFIILEVFFAIYIGFKLPEFVGDISLLKNTVEIRLISVIFFLNLLILIRTLAIIKLNIKKNYKIICAVVAIVIAAIGAIVAFGEIDTQVKLAQMLLSFILFAFAFFFIFASAFDKKYLKGFLATVILISFLTGGFVNPVESGVDYYFNQDIIQETASIVSEDPNANWIVHSPIPIGEIIPVGAHTVNSVNIHPNMDVWSKLDPTGENNVVYNRYAHVVVSIQNNEPTNFFNPQDDIIILNLNVDDLQNLDIKYIITNHDLSSFSKDNISFVEIYQDSIGNRIYEVQYVG